jgi:DNA-binding transcriptional regulator YiaG
VAEALATGTEAMAVAERDRLEERAMSWSPFERTAYNLLLWRRAMKWTQIEAAEALGVGVRTYISWEKGEHGIKRHHVLACWCILKIRAGVV